MKYILSVLLISISFGCAQRNSKGTSTDPEFGPRQKDAKLVLTKTPQTLRILYADSTQPLETTRLFEIAETLMDLGNATGQRQLERSGHRLIAQFYQDQRNYSPVDAKVVETEIEVDGKRKLVVEPNQNLYLEAALGEKWTILQNLVSRNERDLNLSVDAVNKAAAEVKLETASLPSLTGALEQIITFLTNLGDEYKVRGASALVVNEYLTQLREQFLPKLSSLQPHFSRLDLGLGLTDALNTLEIVIATMNGLPIDPIAFDLGPSRKLAQRIDAIKTSADVLDVLIDVWITLSPEKRKDVFYSQSPDLYNFLSGLSEAELREVQVGPSLVWSPVLYYARESNILPALDKFGVGKFQAKLSSSAGAFAAAQLKSSLDGLASQLAVKVSGVVIKKIGVRQLDVAKIRANEKGHFAKEAVKWGRKEILKDGDLLPGAEVRTSALVIRGGELGVGKTESEAKALVYAAPMAAGLRASMKRWSGLEEVENISFSDSNYFKMVLSQLNKLVAISGFRDDKKELYPSYHFTFDPSSELLDLKQFSKYDGRFGVPDELILEKGLSVARNATINNKLKFSASTQAELLSAASETAIYFRDWVKNGFDQKMGSFMLAELLPQIQDPAIRGLSLFPKDKILEVSLGIGAVVVKNLLGPNSGLVLIYPNGKTVTGAELPTILEKVKQKPSDGLPLMSAIVDVSSRGGSPSRARVASVTDAARFLLAIADFGRALEGVQASKSELLSAPSFQSEVQESRQKLSLLIMTLANFISGRMQDENGLFRHSIDLDSGRFNEATDLRDQLLPIRALVVASEILKSDLYRWAAVDGYFALNTHLWDPATGYYRNQKRVAPRLDEMLEIALTLERMQPLLSSESLSQLKRIQSLTLAPLVR